jgi:hypothetical protein
VTDAPSAPDTAPVPASDTPAAPAASAATPAPAAAPKPPLTADERRRRRAAVFGDVLPEGTSDERADGWSEPEADREGSDEWFRRQVPPHHG